ncbi:MAG: DUF3833 family protein [Alphaproteobacteria bacterium]
MPLILEEYFADETRAWGVFEDRFGTPRAQFEVDTEGVWDGETLTLKEHFVYSTGRTDNRTWTIRRLGGGCYRGEADDVIGAAMGESDGNAFVWRYVMDLPLARRSVRVRLSDRLLLQGSGVLIYRARVSKFGVELGRLSMFFVKKRAFQYDPINPAGR